MCRCFGEGDDTTRHHHYRSDCFLRNCFEMKTRMQMTAGGVVQGQMCPTIKACCNQRVCRRPKQLAGLGVGKRKERERESRAKSEDNAGN